MLNKKPLLMCAENMDGYKLEDLFDVVIDELKIKSDKILELGYPFSCDTIKNNEKIISLLKEGKEYQLETMKVHDEWAKNNNS